MQRSCHHIRSSTAFNRHLYVDTESAKAIEEFLNSNQKLKKFLYITDRILEQQNVYYEEYEKLKGYEGITEIRMFPGGLNIRLYCKEFTSPNGNYYVVIIKLLEKKKSEKIDKKIRSILKAIENYEYAF